MAAPAWLPDGVAYAESVIPSPDVGDLGGLFAADMQRWAEKRRQEFLAGRRCVADAYERLGVGAELPAVGADRAPCWPTGVVGSITHTDNRAVAVVARNSDFKALGIDLEHVPAVHAVVAATPDFAATIAHAAEIRLLQSMGERARALSLIFSAKEALFKAVYPRVGVFFDYLDAEVVAWQPGVLRLALTRRLSPDFTIGHQFKLQYQFLDHDVLTFLAESR